MSDRPHVRPERQEEPPHPRETITRHYASAFRAQDAVRRIARAQAEEQSHLALWEAGLREREQIWLRRQRALLIGWILLLLAGAAEVLTARELFSRPAAPTPTPTPTPTLTPTPTPTPRVEKIR